MLLRWRPRLEAPGLWALQEGQDWGSVWSICPCTEGEQLWPLQRAAEVGSAQSQPCATRYLHFSFGAASMEKKGTGAVSAHAEAAALPGQATAPL